MSQKNDNKSGMSSTTATAAKAVTNTVNDGGGTQQRNDDEVQSPPGNVSHGLAGRYVPLETNALRGQLIEPGEDQGDWKTDGEQPESGRTDPIRQLGEVNQYLCHLYDKPGSHHIKHRHAKHITASEF